MRSEETQIARNQRGRQTSEAGGGRDISSMVVGLIDDYMARLRSSPTTQKVEELTGDRGQDPAARLSQLRALIEQMPAQPDSRVAVGATPTKAEHDALVRDVQKIFAAFNAMRILVQ